MMKAVSNYCHKLCAVVSGTPDTNLDGEDRVLDQIISTGDYPDLAGDGDEFDKEKIMKECGFDEMDSTLREELVSIAKKMLKNSEDLQEAVDDAKNGKLDLKARFKINAALWKELAKNRKIYKPQLKEIGKKLPSSMKEKMKNWFSRRWESVKSFFNHPINAITHQKSSHNIQKRSVIIIIALIVGLIVFLLLLALSGGSGFLAGLSF